MTRRGALAGLVLASCSCVAQPTKTGTSAAERIQIAETGCFGTCPIYQASIDRAGRVAYSGTRHVAILGERTTTTGPSSFNAVANLLKPWRPDRPGAQRVGFGSGTKLLPCDDYATDGGEFVITWSSAGGARRLVVDRGCRSPQSAALKTKIREALALLPSAPWAEQRDQ